MSRPPVLTHGALDQALEKLSGWTLVDEGRSLSRDFKFRSFAKAWTFMCRIAAEAEKLDHHPNWSNVYNKVSIRLTTHDQGGVTALDEALAQKIDIFFEES